MSGFCDYFIFLNTERIIVWNLVFYSLSFKFLFILYDIIVSITSVNQSTCKNALNRFVDWFANSNLLVYVFRIGNEREGKEKKNLSKPLLTEQTEYLRRKEEKTKLSGYSDKLHLTNNISLLSVLVKHKRSQTECYC